MRILLTGGTGFIGGRLVPALAESHEVVALARTPPADGSGAEWIEQDLSKPLDLGALPKHVDAVVHLAQSRRYREFPEGAEDVFSLNVRATFDLIEYARKAGAGSFVFTSTGGVYGHSDESFAETDPVNPLNLYMSSKYAAELLIANYGGLLRTIVFRPFFVYGPGQERMLMPTLASRVVAGEPVRIEGEPGLRINPLYVDDAVAAFEPALLSERPGLFNLAGDEPVTITELVGLIGEVAGREPVIEYTTDQAAGDLVGDNSRMKAVLGVQPQTPLSDGLRLLVESL